MAYRKRFQLSDESINTFGFWVVSAGIDLSNIQKNCPLFYNHRTWELPCGHVENIALENSKLFGDIVIDGGNDIEREYIRKIEAGDIKGCSMGFDPIEWSDAPEYVKPGQSRATLTKSQGYEVSLTPLPANLNALALKNGNNLLTLDANSKYDFIPDLKTQNLNMKEIALLLGQPEASTAEQLCAVLKPILANANAVVNLQKTVEEMGKDLPEAQKPIFVTLCKHDMAQAVNFLNLNKVAEVAAPAEAAATDKTVKLTKVSDLIKKGKEKVELAADGKDCFDYLQKFKPLELARLKNEDPEKYAELAADYSNGVRYVK